MSAVICLVWKIRNLATGMGVGVRSIPTGSFGRGCLVLQDPKSPVNTKGTSLMIHPDASMKIYHISIYIYIYIYIWFCVYKNVLRLKL